jgi:hypothetical protein
MLPPEMYQQIIAGLEEQARQLAAQPQQTEVHVTLRQDLLKLAGQFREVAAEPVPDELKPEYGQDILKEAETHLAAVQQAQLDLDKPPAKEPFVPWDGEKLWLDLILALDYEPVGRAPAKTPEKSPTHEAPVAKAPKTAEKPPARKPPVAPIKVKPPPRDDPFGTVKG